MDKTVLHAALRLFCICCAFAATWLWVTVAHGSPLLRGIGDKAAVLELMLRRTPKNQCERYVVNAGKTEQGDYVAIFSWLNKYEEQRCSVDDLDGLVWGWLGMLYENGNGTKQDIDKAIYYYMKSAEKGDSAIQYFLGNCLIGHKKDYKKGLFWLEKSATSGNVSAQFALGIIYSDENSPQYNNKSAFKYFEMGAIGGHVASMYQLARIYYLGDGVDIDIDKSLDLFYDAAERGEEDAAHYVSWLLLHEYEITDELLEEAYLWLEVSKHFGSGLNDDGELEKKLLGKISPNLKAKVDARLPHVFSEIENRKKGP